MSYTIRGQRREREIAALMQRTPGHDARAARRGAKIKAIQVMREDVLPTLEDHLAKGYACALDAQETEVRASGPVECSCTACI